MRADTGPIGGDLSHEFIVLADTGESAVFCHKGLVDKDILGRSIDYNADLQPIVNEWTSLYAATDEMHDKAAFESIPESERLTARGIEVGHIFYFGTKYSKPMNAVVAGPGGEQITPEMGSYGIGVSRLVGGIIEASHDDAGIVWPESVAPFKVAIVDLKPDDGAVAGTCSKLYQALQSKRIEVLHDDRDLRPGAKFADMDLIGIPWQVIVGPKGVTAGKAELKNRKTGAREELPFGQVADKLAGQLAKAG
jgi:prolyl-tRNA synthetase